MEDKKNWLGVNLVDEDANPKDYFISDPKTTGYNFVSKKITCDENFAIYSLGVRVLMPWSYYFRALSTLDAFEVTQSSSVISSFDRDEYRVTVKRSLGDVKYEFPDSLVIKLLPQTLSHLPFSVYAKLSEKEFEENLKKEQDLFEDLIKPKPPMKPAPKPSPNFRTAKKIVSDPVLSKSVIKEDSEDESILMD